MQTSSWSNDIADEPETGVGKNGTVANEVSTARLRCLRNLSCVILCYPIVVKACSRLDCTTMTRAKSNDPCNITVLDSSGTLILQTVPLLVCSTALIRSSSFGASRPYVPPRFRRKVFSSPHGWIHHGVSLSPLLITNRFIWPGVNTDIRTLSLMGVRCQFTALRSPKLTSRCSMPVFTTFTSTSLDRACHHQTVSATCS